MNNNFPSSWSLRRIVVSLKVTCSRSYRRMFFFLTSDALLSSLYSDYFARSNYKDFILSVVSTINRKWSCCAGWKPQTTIAINSDSTFRILFPFSRQLQSRLFHVSDTTSGAYCPERSGSVFCTHTTHGHTKTLFLQNSWFAFPGWKRSIALVKSRVIFLIDPSGWK